MQLQPTRVHLYSKSACVQARFMCPSVMPIASLEDAESRRYNPFLYAMAYKKGLYLLLSASSKEAMGITLGHMKGL